MVWPSFDQDQERHMRHISSTHLITLAGGALFALATLGACTAESDAWAATTSALTASASYLVTLDGQAVGRVGSANGGNPRGTLRHDSPKDGHTRKSIDAAT